MNPPTDSARPEVSRPEFSRIVRLDEIGRMQWPTHVEADEAECAALAKRFGFAALDWLSADFSLVREGKTVFASGSIGAQLAQPCIATGDSVAEEVQEEFAIRFVPEGEANRTEPGEEIEIDAEACDILPYAGERIDMGEAIAETLALAVNPYPRSPGADAWLRDAGVMTEEQAGPFAALAALKAK
ncbi:MAG: DUF177 domain-containing protein [Sphingobium sp.]